MADIELPNMQNLVGLRVAQSGSSHPRERGDTEALSRASGSVNNNDDGHDDSDDGHDNNDDGHDNNDDGHDDNDDGHKDDQSNFAIL